MREMDENVAPGAVAEAEQLVVARVPCKTKRASAAHESGGRPRERHRGAGPRPLLARRARDSFCAGCSTSKILERSICKSAAPRRAHLGSDVTPPTPTRSRGTDATT